MTTNHPHVYVARHSHANYPNPKTYYRIYFMANDKTSDKGILWKVNNIKLITNETNWNNYNGYMGAPDHCPTPKNNPWWEHENGISTNFFNRIFKCN